MDKLTACPVCDGADFEAFLTTRDHFLTGEEFSIVQCVNCRFLMTQPRPAENALSSYYHSEEYISHSNTDKGLVSRLYKIVRNHSLDKKVELLKKFKPAGKVLDIGCGTGHYLDRLAQHGFEPSGVEPEPAAREFAIREFKLNVWPDLFELNGAKGEYDAITLWHVLEHVYHLNNYMSEIKRLLSSDGMLIIAVPNPESYDAMVYEKHWAAYDLPRHLYHFTRETMHEFATKHQFDLVDIAPMKFDSYYVSMLSEKYKNGKNNYLAAFLTGLKSNFRAKRSNNNYSSLIYILKPKN